MLNKILLVFALVSLSSLFFYLGQGYKEVSTVTNIPFADPDVRHIMNGELKACSMKWGSCGIDTVLVNGIMYYSIYPSKE